MSLFSLFFQILVSIQFCFATPTDDQLGRNLTLEIQRLTRLKDNSSRGWMNHLNQVRLKALAYERSHSLSKPVSDNLINAIGDLDVKLWKAGRREENTAPPVAKVAPAPAPAKAPPAAAAVPASKGPTLTPTDMACFTVAARRSWGTIYNDDSTVPLAAVFRHNDNSYVVATPEGVCPLDLSKIDSLPKIVDFNCGSFHKNLIFKKLEYMGKHLQIDATNEELKEIKTASFGVSQKPLSATAPGTTNMFENVNQSFDETVATAKYMIQKPEYADAYSSMLEDFLSPCAKWIKPSKIAAASHLLGGTTNAGPGGGPAD